MGNLFNFLKRHMRAEPQAESPAASPPRRSQSPKRYWPHAVLFVKEVGVKDLTAFIEPFAYRARQKDGHIEILGPVHFFEGRELLMAFYLALEIGSQFPEALISIDLVAPDAEVFAGDFKDPLSITSAAFDSYPSAFGYKNVFDKKELLDAYDHGNKGLPGWKPEKIRDVLLRIKDLAMKSAV